MLLNFWNTKILWRYGHDIHMLDSKVMFCTGRFIFLNESFTPAANNWLDRIDTKMYFILRTCPNTISHFTEFLYFCFSFEVLPKFLILDFLIRTTGVRARWWVFSFSSSCFSLSSDDGACTCHGIEIWQNPGWNLILKF